MCLGVTGSSQAVWRVRCCRLSVFDCIKDRMHDLQSMFDAESNVSLMTHLSMGNPFAVQPDCCSSRSAQHS